MSAVHTIRFILTNPPELDDAYSVCGKYEETIPLLFNNSWRCFHRTDVVNETVKVDMQLNSPSKFIWKWRNADKDRYEEDREHMHRCISVSDDMCAETELVMQTTNWCQVNHTHCVGKGSDELQCLSVPLPTSTTTDVTAASTSGNITPLTGNTSGSATMTVLSMSSAKQNSVSGFTLSLPNTGGTTEAQKGVKISYFCEVEPVYTLQHFCMVV